MSTNMDGNGSKRVTILFLLYYLRTHVCGTIWQPTQVVRFYCPAVNEPYVRSSSCGKVYNRLGKHVSGSNRPYSRKRMSSTPFFSQT